MALFSTINVIVYDVLGEDDMMFNRIISDILKSLYRYLFFVFVSLILQPGTAL